MRIAIFGAGKAGHHLFTQITAKQIDMKIMGFIDNKMAGEIEDIKIYKPEEYFCEFANKTDAIIIAAGNQKTVKLMIDTILSYGINQIYMVHDIVAKCELSIFDEHGLLPYRVRKIRFSAKKPTLPYFEIPITDLCNLNCKGCLFACNVKSSGTHVNLEQIRADLIRMSELFEDIPWIRILGGEPLMHPDLIDILSYARECFPDSEIDLCTNGMLIPKMKESIWDCIMKHRISVHISGYEPTYEIMDEIHTAFLKHDLAYAVLKRDEFVKYYTLDDNHVEEKSYRNCIASACREVYNGRLSTCSAAIAYTKLNQQFGTNYEIKENVDWFNIHNPNIDIWNVVNKLDHPADMCKYCSDCKVERFHWAYAGSNPKLSDYVIEK